MSGSCEIISISIEGLAKRIYEALGNWNEGQTWFWRKHCKDYIAAPRMLSFLRIRIFTRQIMQLLTTRLKLWLVANI